MVTGSPGLPRSPGEPGAPWMPGDPGMPTTPGKPRSPLSPWLPYNHHLHISTPGRLINQSTTILVPTDYLIDHDQID